MNMKKTFAAVLFCLIGMVSLAQQEKAYEGRWVHIGTPFRVPDIYGDTVDLQAWLDSGYCVLFDYFTLLCRPCWKYHEKGVLARLYDYFGPNGTNQLRVASIALENPSYASTMAEGNTVHDWTLGGTVPYPLICNNSCLEACRELYQGAVPYFVFVGQYGYYRKIALCLNSDADNRTNIAHLIDIAQTVGTETVPVVSINGHNRVAKGCPSVFSSEVDCVGSPYGYVWNIENGSFTYAVSEDVNVSWSEVGDYRVTLQASNMAGTGYDTMMVHVFEWEWGDTLSYVADRVDTGATLDGMKHWGVVFPPQALTDKNCLREVEFYTDTAFRNTITLNVYQGGEYAPESLIFRKKITACDAGWNRVDCGALEVDGMRNLWVTFSTMYDFAPSVEAYAGDPNSCRVSADGNVWFPLYEYDPGNPAYDKSWMIRAVMANQVGVEPLDATRPTVYPNPTTGRLTVKADGVESVSVMDLDGKILYSTHDSSMDIGFLPDKVYMLIINCGDTAYMQKVHKVTIDCSR